MSENKNTLNKLLNDEGLKTTSHLETSEMIEYLQAMARLTKIKYDELIKQGFSKGDALELCKNLLSTST